jgi:tripartite-type tricarboxylate transporter receptor subunit TctC
VVQHRTSDLQARVRPADSPDRRTSGVATLVLIAAIALGFAAVSAHAQSSFPNRPIRVVSPFPAGAVSDISLRILADRVGARLNTQMIVQNQPSGGGIVAAREALSAPADGYTLALLSNATAVSAALFKHLPFDPLADFVPVSGMSDFAYLFLTNYQSNLHTLPDFLAAARAKPGAMNVGTSDAGTTPYLTALRFKKAAGIDFTIVPFHGASELIVALLRNDVDVVINAYGAYRQSLADKQLRAIATTTASRSAFLPDVPTMQEAGVPNFEVSSWNGVFASAHTPAPLVDRLAQEIRAALAEPDLANKFHDLGIEVWPAAGAELSARMRSEIGRWNRVVDEAGIERQ